MKNSFRVLILDDSEADLLLIEKELRKTNMEFAACQVSSRPSFIRALEEFSPDVILADYRLPSFTGREALQIVRQQKGNSVPFIIVTGELDEKTAADFMQAGADDYVLKENIKQIAPALLSVLQKKQVRVEKEIAEQLSRKRGAILEAISFSAERLLRSPYLKKNIAEVLSQLGRATESAAINVFQLVDPRENSQSFSNSYFWSVDNSVNIQPENAATDIIAAEEILKIFPDLDSGKVHTVSGETLPPNIRHIFCAGAENLIVVVPIFVGNRWEGFFAYSLPTAGEEWSPAEVEALRAAAGIIGGAIQREKSEADINMLAHAIQSIQEAVCIVRPAKNIVFVNDAFTNIYGYSKDKITGQNVLCLFAEEGAPKKLKQIFLKAGKAGWQGEILCRRKDGSTLPADLSVSRLLDSEENTTAYVLIIRDLTLARQAQYALQTSKAHLSSILENTEDSIFSFDTQFRIIFLNSVFQHLFFRAFGVELRPGMNVIEYLPPEIKPEWQEVLGKSFDGKPFVYEWSYKHENRLRHFEISFHPIFESDNAQRGTAVFGREITARKQIEEQLRQQARQRKYLLDISQSVLSSLELPEVINRMHDALEQVVHIDTSGVYLADEEQGQLIPYLHASTFRFSRELQNKALSIDKSLSGFVFKTGEALLANNAHLDPRSTYPAGAKIECEHLISIPIFSNGKTLGVISINRLSDPPFNQEEFELIKLFSNHVSLAIANARLFEKTRQSEMKFRTLFEESRDVVFICDRNWKFLDMNPAGMELFGLTERGRLSDQANPEIFFPDANAFQLLNRQLIQQKFIQDYEIEMRTLHGECLDVLITANVMTDQNGEITAYRGFIRDVSEQKRMADQLRHAQRMESLGTLAGGIAHDFNNLLAIILGYSSLLEQGDMEKERLQWISSSIETAVERGASLVNQILTFARKQPSQFGAIQLNNIVTETIRLLNETFPKTIDFRMQLAENLPQINADNNQIHQTIINLCVNAKDAMENVGQLTIKTGTVAGRQLRQKFPKAEDGPYVYLSIQDTGTGINDEVKEHIFEPFFTTKPRGRGTGLGLAVVYGMIQGHHGFIDVTSHPGEGALFELFFPASDEAEPLPVKEPETAVGEGSENILLVEDEEMLQNLMKQFILSKGYGFLGARDGLSAVKLFRQKHRDIALVIMDLGLPKLGGWDAYLQMREINPEIKVVFASGYFDPKIKKQMNDLNINHSLKKPYNPKEVFKIIRQVLD